MADFALAGQAALDEPERASRMVMFRMYYLGMAPYETARHFLGLSERIGCTGAKRFGEGAEQNAAARNVSAEEVLWNWMKSSKGIDFRVGAKEGTKRATKGDRERRWGECRSMSLAGLPRRAEDDAKFRNILPLKSGAKGVPGA